MADRAADSDDDGEYADTQRAFRVHDLVERGDVEKLRALLPIARAAGGANGDSTEDNADVPPPHQRQTMALEATLLDKDDMGCLPLHVAAIHQRLDCLQHLLRYSEPLASAMLRLKCGPLATPFVHLLLRVGAVRREFCEAAVADLFGSPRDGDGDGTGAGHSSDFRALLLEKLAARDEEGNNVFHLCAMFDLDAAFGALAAFVVRHNGADQAAGKSALAALLEKGNRLGFRPLHLAMKFRSLRVATKLLDDHRVNVNCRTSLQQTPAHIAALVGFADGARELVKSGRVDLSLVDMWGHMAAHVAHKCKFPAVATIFGSSSAGGDVEEDSSSSSPFTARFFYHDEVLRHIPLALHHRGGPEPPAETPERVATLVSPEFGILRSHEFQQPHIEWDSEIERADIADVLRVHEFHYVDKMRQRCAALAASVTGTKPTAESTAAEATLGLSPDPEEAGESFAWDYDTALSVRSYDAAFRAAGAVCKAVDAVVGGECTNAFCIVRPPGHHAGPVGKVVCENDPEGSLGFCLFNNVAVGAAYARAHFKHRGIHKVAILDFDVHHGNGTEEIVRQLVPSTVEVKFETPYGCGSQSVHQYKPWRNEQDAENVFFCSVHGFGHKDPENEHLHTAESQAWFYPGSGESGVKQQPLIWNVGLGFCPDGAAVSRLKWRTALRDQVLPKLREFNPDLIFLSAGFDAHKKELVNWGYISLLEQDYEWLVHHVKQVANACCDGRLISVLEGGYNFHGRMVSPFARSVAAHARALVTPSRDEWDDDDIAKEAAHERKLLDNYLNPTQPGSATVLVPVVKKRTTAGTTSSDPSVAQGRGKRARKAVDYVALAKELAAEQPTQQQS